MYLVWYVSGRICSMDRDIQHTVLNDAVDFVKLAEAMGAAGYPCNDTEKNLQEAFAEGTSILVNLW